ncbi:MAG: HDIG domain-containing protein [Muribaculaceae bacterium]|nr:HDIG domain-containing protein [Muribaculaceae bacterium]
MNDTFDYNRIIDKYYPVGRKVGGILRIHSRAVADEALAIARRKKLDINPADIEAAAMLHDIGIIYTNAPGIGCYGSAPYLCHGPIGADILRSEGAPERFARVAERHTGAGLTARDIEVLRLPMPPGRIYMPETLLEKLVCYADCYYSKSGDMQRKEQSRVEASMAKFGQTILERFLELHSLFS